MRRFFFCSYRGSIFLLLKKKQGCMGKWDFVYFHFEWQGNHPKCCTTEIWDSPLFVSVHARNWQTFGVNSKTMGSFYVNIKKSLWKGTFVACLYSSPHEIRRATYSFFVLILIPQSLEIWKFTTQIRLGFQTATYKLVLLTATSLMGVGVMVAHQCFSEYKYKQKVEEWCTLRMGFPGSPRTFL